MKEVNNDHHHVFKCICFCSCSTTTTTMMTSKLMTIMAKSNQPSQITLRLAIYHVYSNMFRRYGERFRNGKSHVTYIGKNMLSFAMLIKFHEKVQKDNNVTYHFNEWKKIYFIFLKIFSIKTLLV